MRISVTALDAYRWYCDSDMELADLLAQLRKETPPTPAMLAGKALHAALENIAPDAPDAFKLEQDGYAFKFTGECAIRIPYVRELKGEKLIHTTAGDVTLVGVVDGMDGTEIFDHKLTAQFNAEKYADSYQWRCYLVMFGGRKFTYNCFVGKEEEPNEWVIYDFQPLSFYAYPLMEKDVQREVEWFAQFWRKHMEPQSVAA